MLNKLIYHGETFTVTNSSGHRLIWWGGMQYRFAMNPMLHRTILRVSIIFA